MTASDLATLELALWRGTSTTETVEEWLQLATGQLMSTCSLTPTLVAQVAADGRILALPQGCKLASMPARATTRLAAAVRSVRGDITVVPVEEQSVSAVLGEQLVIIGSTHDQDALLIGCDGTDGVDLLAAIGRASDGPWNVVHERQRMVRVIDDYESQLSGAGSVRAAKVVSDTSIIGAEQGLALVVERVRLVAHSDAAVLLLGETGSGKEVIARLIHHSSRRLSGPFIRVNCAAIPPELVDSQLFGHERGSFTGAMHQHIGWFERADGGTLLLDEVAELPLAAQARLLRVLQDGELERVGGRRTLRVNCRLIASTHRDLPTMVSEGVFREDLWYRLTTFPILIPPLRDRREDIPDLATHFSRRAAVRYGVRASSPSAEDIELLQHYHWPGNVRELASVINRAVLLGDGSGLRVRESLGISLANGHGGVSPRLRDTLEEQRLEPLDTTLRRYLDQVLRAVGGRIEGDGGAAEVLALHPSTLRSKLRRLGLDSARYRR